MDIKSAKAWLFPIIVFMTAASYGSIDYSKNPQAAAFAEKMHKKYGFNEMKLLKLLKKARHQPETLDRYTGKRKIGATDFSWHRYKSKILIKESIDLGVEFMKKWKKWLDIASRRYSVSPEIITSFIRVESKFGIYGHEYPVWDSLVTLAFNKNRKQGFFRGELEKLLILCRKNHLDPLELKGSFAGAMGCVQQVPSIQLKYGVDLDGNGRRDPDSMADCIGSIAAFLHRNGWSEKRITISRAHYNGKRFRGLKTGYRSLYDIETLKKHGVKGIKKWPHKKAYLIKLRDKDFDELYLGDRNYRIITLYNASSRYAVTIALYSKALKNASKR